jgi:hypothetical protein
MTSCHPHRTEQQYPGIQTEAVETSVFQMITFRGLRPLTTATDGSVAKTFRAELLKKNLAL